MEPILKAVAIDKVFGGLKALNNVSLEVYDGEIVGLIGPNGAGKTTLFNIVAGVYAASAGDVEFLGKNVNKTPTYRRVEMGMGRTFQNIKLFPNVNAIENVMTGQHCRMSSWFIPIIIGTPGTRADEKKNRDYSKRMLEFVGLLDKEYFYAKNLPYGEQRSLEIARALATEPALLLLDEPCAGMNETEKDNLQLLVKDIRDKLNITVLIIEHDMKVVMNLCERIVVLSQGEKICEGTPDKVRQETCVIEAYLGSSMGKRDRFVKNR